MVVKAIEMTNLLDAEMAMFIPFQFLICLAAE